MVALGWFREEALAASGLSIDVAAAEEAVRSGIAEPLGLDLYEAAAGIYRIAVNNMVEAIRINSVSKGYDPRDFALVPFGGAGAAFACEAAAQLSIPRVVVPTRPGVGAAAGLLATDTKYEYRATLWASLQDADTARIESAYRSLAEKAGSQLRRAGFGDEDTSLRYLAECRYVGQGYELPVEVPAPPVDADWVAAVAEGFHRAHEQAYLRRFDDKPVMIVNVGLAGIGHVPPPVTPEVERGGSEPDEDALLDTRPVRFVQGNEAVSHSTSFYSRPALKAGNRIAGPAVLEQADTTTVLPPGTLAEVDRYGNLIVGFAERAHG
jgi:N-methylhydantoinase A/oxoprolinase/acetone carboxylase beta subunit